MNNKEKIDGLRSELASQVKSKAEALQTIQAAGVDVLAEIEAARASGDDGLISETSEKFDRIGEQIKSAQEEIEALQEKMDFFKDVQLTEDGAEVKTRSREDLEALIKGLESDTPAMTKKTVGQLFADVLEYRGIKSANDAFDKKAETSLTAFFGEKTQDYVEAQKSMKSIKSLYANFGEAFDDGGDVPGFMGVQCGLVEDRNIYCLLDPPADDFEECITRETLNGNRIRFNREVARENNAASVLETIYNPYPDFAQDGTKPEGSFTIGTSEVNVSKIAEFIVASDEVLEDCSFVASMIDHVLTSNLNQEKRRQLIAGTGLNGQMRGILNQPDVLTRTHQDTGDGGLAEDNVYDTFRRSLTDIWLQNGSTENVCAIMHPRDIEFIDLTKDEFGRYLFNDNECFTRMLRCLRLRQSVDMPQGTAVVGNFANNWVFYLRKALEIRMGYTGDQFITNTNTILAELRGLSLLRCPRKVVKVDGLSTAVSS